MAGFALVITAVPLLLLRLLFRGSKTTLPLAHEALDVGVARHGFLQQRADLVGLHRARPEANEDVIAAEEVRRASNLATVQSAEAAQFAVFPLRAESAGDVREQLREGLNAVAVQQHLDRRAVPHDGDDFGANRGRGHLRSGAPDATGPRTAGEGVMRSGTVVSVREFDVKGGGREGEVVVIVRANCKQRN